MTLRQQGPQVRSRLRTIFTWSRANFVLLLILTFSLLAGGAQARQTAGAHGAGRSGRSAADARQRAAARFAAHSGHVPLTFEANEGQADSRVQFLARGPGYTLFLTGGKAVLTLRNSPAALTMTLAGANPAAASAGLDELQGKSNYFLGRDPAKWHSNVPNYARVKYKDVYPGIDLVYYGNQGYLEYDFEIAPGADAKTIAFDLAGARSPRVDRGTGDLVIGAAGSEIRLHRPVVYQLPADGDGSGTGRTIVKGGYKITAGGHVTFALAGYDHTRPLVIDPALSYSTYFGGSLDDSGRAIALDSAGDLYLTGTTCSSNLPVLGGVQQAYGGDGGNCAPTNGGDAFVAEFDSTLTTLLYATYLGGTGDDAGNGIAVDSVGNAYITGSTCSGDSFPITAGAFQTIYGGGPNNCTQGLGDGFVTELDPTGSALVYSTFLGGGKADTGNAISLDASNNAYILGTTCSTDFPTTSGAFQTTFGGVGNQCTAEADGDAFITKLNPTGSALIYSTYLGGRSGDAGYGMALDSAGDVYVAGKTFSNNFPVTPGAYSTMCKGCRKFVSEAFVSKLNPAGTSLIYSTYLGGGSGSEPCAACATGIAIDGDGNAYVSGLTSDATDFPILNGFQRTYAGGPHDAFLTKLNPQGSALVYSTFLGGQSDDGATALAVSDSGNAYLRGNTISRNFPKTPDAFQGTCICYTGNYQGFLSEFSPAGNTLVYSTFLGGTENQFSGSTRNLIITAAQSPKIYFTGYSNSTDYPVTINAYQGAAAGGYDAVLTEFISGSNVSLLPTGLNFGSQQVGTSGAPMSVTLGNEGEIALTVQSITISGPNSGDFSQTNTCGNSVPPLENCAVTVTFTPLASGQRSAQVSIKDNGGGSPQLVSLRGTGTQ